MHDQTIANQGGMLGIRSQHSLEAALFRPRATFAGEEIHPTLEAKGAALIEGIVGGHPFVDGNKRTGILALETFLDLNGYQLTADEDEKYSFVISLAQGKLSLEEITRWISRWGEKI